MKQNLENYYKNNLTNFSDHRALGWETQEAQSKRFEVFLKNTDLRKKSLLDVGCGLGDLYGCLKSLRIPVNYMGIDILPEMISKAKQKYPEGLFVLENIFDKTREKEVFPEKSFDVIFSSGLFNLNTEETNSMLRKALITFRELAKEKIVFNLLSDSSPNKEDEYCYYSQKYIDNLLRLLKFSKNHITYLTGYLPNDFTIIIDIK
jgi:SAM-dependent methyltransferase